MGSNKSRFLASDILFGKLRPYFHKVGVPPVDGVCSTDIVVIRPMFRELRAFVLGHVSSNDFVDYANAGSSGTRMPRTRWSDMAAYPMAVPPLSLCRAFGDVERPLLDAIRRSIFEARTLAMLRDALLPMLVNGQA